MYIINTLGMGPAQARRRPYVLSKGLPAGVEVKHFFS
jgi:hypothetical protein